MSEDDFRCKEELGKLRDALDFSVVSEMADGPAYDKRFWKTIIHELRNSIKRKEIDYGLFP